MAEEYNDGSTPTCHHIWQSNAEGDRICRRCGRVEHAGRSEPGELRGAYTEHAMKRQMAATVGRSADPINTAMNVAGPTAENRLAGFLCHFTTQELQSELQRRRLGSGVNFETLRDANMSRVVRWHGQAGVKAWSLSDWGVAFAGEAGEACDKIKKFNRIIHGVANESDIRGTADARREIMLELADTITYADLIAAWLKEPLAPWIRIKFNTVSEKYDFPERL